MLLLIEIDIDIDGCFPSDDADENLLLSPLPLPRPLLGRFQSVAVVPNEILDPVELDLDAPIDRSVAGVVDSLLSELLWTLQTRAVRMGSDGPIRREYRHQPRKSSLFVSFVLLPSGWSKHLQIGAYDCASESVTTNEICEDQVYPQWRIFCPRTNSTHPIFKTQEETQLLTAEGIFRSAIEKMNEIAATCFGESWPIREKVQ